ncbi:chromosome segregation protein SMC [Occallatibacter riparius]|uniref:Chromosome partition protein Smc n=1 Tax=Occallatibacter riparius TaxID=1002689 RepID=A0A9J7BLZ4_9BACT|nr:chromosome segregation protein SMC [Occallatibacter riparius]UWZ82229.1 chromosome segregation protein SMC [Occallatibacter riparius]
MLKLKKVQILGFKSFCDRTELTVSGTGMAVVVGPNGCGKSNILDAVSWVLGEQSAKTLRGTHMSDVIFAGTRDRKPLGMAEVTLTMVDPESYEGPIPVEPEVTVDQEPTDWDEEALRKQRAAESDEIVAAEQPGQSQEEEVADTAAAQNAQAAQEGLQAVVLKIRRRKFQRTFAKGEIVITRRLFRTGESEYLLNGKLCRLRDIQDIFMGTGLGPESYAIIGQERIGQLLSSKPHDRRAIIEEAAGITRFKTKKRLAELRLESAKQNLARVDDIFEEVTRQMNSLKRQAAKAERFAQVRDELRAKLRVVLASRMAHMDSEQARLDAEIAELTEKINVSAGEIGDMEASQHTLTERGYEIEKGGQEAQTRANSAAVELERAAARERGNTERVADLEARMAAATAEAEQTRTQLAGIVEERAQQHAFLESASGDARAFHQKVAARQQEARSAQEEVFNAERQLEANRRHVMHLLTLAGNARNSTAQAEESLAALEREAERLEAEMGQSRNELENLGVQSGQARLTFESSTERLKQLEGEIASLREQLQARRAEENGVRAKANQLRSEHASLGGRKNSLESLIRNHSYSTNTVRQLLKPGALGQGMAPVGTLADFLEVSSEHEDVVDEFLRDELNYLVVNSWTAAEHGVNMLKSGVDGRATFLVHPENPAALMARVEAEEDVRGNGIVPLKDTIKVLNGFGRSLEAILPKLKNGYIVEDTGLAQQLSEQYTKAFFLTPGGECFHNTTVTGGKPASEGPLALKRDLRETEKKLAAVEAALGEAEAQAASLTRTIEDLTRQLEERSEERRQAEREMANQGAALKQMESEVQRIDRRFQEWTLQAARNKDAREAKHALIDQKRDEAVRLEQQHGEAELSLDAQQAALVEIRQKREGLQQEAAQLTAELAGLEERRRGAEAAFQRIDRLHADLERRVLAIEQQRAAAEAEREQRIRESETLSARQEELTAVRAEAVAQAQALAAEAQELRHQLANLETQLKTGRAGLDQLRDDRANRASELAKLKSDLEHLEASCLAEVNVEAVVLREDKEIAHIEGEALTAQEDECRGLKQRIEQMGPVNMMALDEYKETADRHGFLETQRKDLIESIENTQETIKEIDQISRQKFDEAFAKINENFANVFTRLFHGGQAFLRLTDAENSAESGLDIVASPPGKKLQNVLLLSGGEKALTAISLLVGIFQFQPSPFCVLDEVDAALDETNVGRLADLLHGLSKDTQFLLVTHSKRMMHSADMIYGVTMQEPGVSKVVSVQLSHHEPQRATA